MARDPRRRVTLLHGFTQDGSSWLPVLEHLAAFDVSTPDLPGHGASPTPPRDIPGMAALVAELGESDVIGYSMGGRVALQLAIDAPEKVGRLVLVGANPGIIDEMRRDARRTADERWIRLLRDIGIDVFLAQWLAQPMFGGFTQEQITEMVQRRSGSNPETLASSLELAGVGVMAPMWDRLDDIAHQTLIVVGSKDRKFSAIADQMAGKIPNSQVAIIAGAGHAAHLEDPVAFTALVREFLGGHVGTPNATS